MLIRVEDACVVQLNDRLKQTLSLLRDKTIGLCTVALLFPNGFEGNHLISL